MDFTDKQILIPWAPEPHALVVRNIKGYLTLDQSSSACAGNSAVLLYVQGQTDCPDSKGTYPAYSLPPAILGSLGYCSAQVSLCQWKRLSLDTESDLGRSPHIKAVWGLNCAPRVSIKTQLGLIINKPTLEDAATDKDYWMGGP